MCHTSSIEFARRAFDAIDLSDKQVIEVGALDFNGSVKALALRGAPKSYMGVDMQAGPGVDVVCDGAALVERFGRESFDVVVATELMEHARDWRAVIANMKQVLREGGAMVITTRSRGFDFHAYPHDYWRYEPEDMQEIFDDFKIVWLERDPEKPGVFIYAQKPARWVPADLDHISLYSILLWRRRGSVGRFDLPIGIPANYLSKLARMPAAKLPARVRRTVKAWFGLGS